MFAKSPWIRQDEIAFISALRKDANNHAVPLSGLNQLVETATTSVLL